MSIPGIMPDIPGATVCIGGYAPAAIPAICCGIAEMPLIPPIAPVGAIAVAPTAPGAAAGCATLWR